MDDIYVFHEDNECMKWRLRENITFFGSFGIFKHFNYKKHINDKLYGLDLGYIHLKCNICGKLGKYWIFPFWPKCCTKTMILTSHWF